jgi:hypothetical protein
MSPKERIEALKSAPSDSCVAFSQEEERIVACATTYDEVVSKAEREGETDPVIVKVPKDWTPVVLRWSN